MERNIYIDVRAMLNDGREGVKRGGGWRPFLKTNKRRR